MTPQTVRRAAVAGRFYPADPDELRSEVEGFLSAGRKGDPVSARGVLAPHAGYVFSGPIAGKVFAQVVVPKRVIILAPNHTGLGERVSVVPSGAFRMPGVEVPVDEELATAILRESPLAAADVQAHQREHAVEVEIPFLVARQPELEIVPIVLSMLSEKEAIDLGHAISRAIDSVSGEVLVVASSDMSHYLPDTEARTIDRVALEPLLAFDASRLYRTVREHGISMCGFIPATVMLAYARAAGAKEVELVGYATSGDAYGDRDRVVGYAGVLVR